ncbi:MAG: hypothetical protein ACLQNE_03415 [Thermoguttaceae bacterium]
MSNATHEMACLFTDREAPSDVTGSLATAAELLNAIDPGLLLLADGNGEVLAFHDMGAGVTLDVAGELALCMATRLLGPDHHECRFEFPTEPRVRLAFAVRLPLDTEEAVFGGLVELSNRSQRRLNKLRATLGVCGKLVWTTIRIKQMANAVQMRAKNLSAQQATLEASHVEAANGPIASDELKSARLRRRNEQHTKDLEGFAKDVEVIGRLISRDLQKPMQLVTQSCQSLLEHHQDLFDPKAASLIRGTVDAVSDMRAFVEDLLGRVRARQST